MPLQAIKGLLMALAENTERTARCERDKWNSFRSLARRISMEWKMATGLIGILIYFFLLSHHGLRTYFDSDDLMNLVQLHGYWRWPWWQTALNALLVVTPTYRPMGDVFYRLLYWAFGSRSPSVSRGLLCPDGSKPGPFFRFALLLSRWRKAALLSTLVFSFHAALDNLYFSTGTVYDILCVCFTLAPLTLRESSQQRPSTSSQRYRDLSLTLWWGSRFQRNGGFTAARFASV